MLQDVIEGRVSPERAREDYGVVLIQKPGSGMARSIRMRPRGCVPTSNRSDRRHRR